MGNQNPYIEEEQTTQWSELRKSTKDKQRSTKRKIVIFHTEYLKNVRVSLGN